MVNLLSEKSRSDERLNLLTDIGRQYLPIKARAGQWVSAALGFGAVSLGLIGGGLSLLGLGKMPDLITLVEPVISSNKYYNEDYVFTLFMVVCIIFATPMMITAVFRIAAIFREGQGNVSGSITLILTAVAIFAAPQVFLFAVGVTEANKPTPYSYIKAQFETAAESGDWSKAWNLLKPVPDTVNDIVVLKAQVAYKAGFDAESVRLIQAIQPDAEFAEQVWLIESMYADSHKETDYQLTEASQVYADNMASRRSLGATMIKGFVPFGALTALIGCVAFALRRNALTLQLWLNKVEGKQHD